MPIYAYRCSSCGLQKDHLQKMSDPALTECPECGKSTYGKMLTAPQFQLKGSGWYVTDFRNGGSKPSGGDSGKTGSSDGDAKKDASSDSSKDSGSKASSSTDSASKDSSSKDSSSGSSSSSAAPAASAG